MLDQRDASSLNAATWEAADKTTELSVPEDEFLAHEGPTPVDFNSRRSYHRFYFRGKAILRRGNETLAVYTSDLSRKGLGLVAPLQLFPKECVTLRLSDGRECQLEIVRCRRVGQNCYECGSRFVVGLRINDIHLEE